MDDLSIYLKSADLNWTQDLADTTIGFHISSSAKDLPSLKGVELAIIGIKEGRNTGGNEGTAMSPDAIRQQLYRLYVPREQLRIADLGDIVEGHSIDDTLFALEQVCISLIKQDILPIVIGGADYVSLAVYRAFCSLERPTNVVAIDPKFDVQDSDGEIDCHNHLSRLILHKPGFLFNYINVGYQTYLVDPEMARTMKRMFFDIYRLGEVNADLREMEPVLRQADMLSVDMRVVRMSDSPGHANPLPNGLYGEQLCQLALYAGLNERLKAFCLLGMNPEFDPRQQSAQLAAQAIWCFVEGFMERHKEDVSFDSSEFNRYRVDIKGEHEIIFMKSKITERWWMEVPYPASGGNRFRRSEMIPCSYKDYKTAAEQEEIPDRWVQTFQKLQ